jgi:hypothetical protein
MKKEQSVPKRRHINFRPQGITQKKAYNMNMYLFTSKSKKRLISDYSSNGTKNELARI